ncbi:hypothetical protein [uncultured Rhodoblastus sp.]|uniref:hypothetical protein n=1 Tax=uncultured Rhodoblastus sp. TaxID=543037 RepID=UPI002600F64C|nr:hypothetical protein [uncultured Rhodoblastus sp.]
MDDDVGVNGGRDEQSAGQERMVGIAELVADGDGDAGNQQPADGCRLPVRQKDKCRNAAKK